MSTSRKKLHNVTVYDYYIADEEESDVEADSDDEDDVLDISAKDKKIQALEVLLNKKDQEIIRLKKLLKDYTPYKNKEEMEYHKSVQLSMFQKYHKSFKKKIKRCDP